MYLLCRGVIPRAFDHIFDHVASTFGTKFLLTASYLEIYNEEVRDLLGKDVKKKLELHEHPEKGVYVQGISTHKVKYLFYSSQCDGGMWSLRVSVDLIKLRIT